MENENKEILNENIPVSDEEIEEVAGGVSIDTTLKPTNPSQVDHKKFG